MQQPEGFIDTGYDSARLGSARLRVGGGQARWPFDRLGDPGGLDASERAKLTSVRAELERTQNERLRGQLDAVQVLKGHGFTQARKPGRPAKKGKAAA
jgi:hypothetical protein